MTALAVEQRLRFKLGPGALALEANDCATLAVLDRVYGPMRCAHAQPQPHTASIRRLADGRFHARFGRHVVSSIRAGIEPPERAAYGAAREIFARFAASLPGTLAFYGAAVGVRDGGILILGPATVGKTLLALHLADQGATFLGDETAIVSMRSAELFAMPRRPSLRESALPWLPSDSMARSVAQAAGVIPGERGRFWYALDRDDLGGVAPSERALPLRMVCIVRERAEACSIRRIDTGDALPAIAQRAYARPSELSAIAALRKALRGVLCLEITLGRPDESAAAILREVSACV